MYLLLCTYKEVQRRLPNGSYALIDPSADVVDNKAYAVCVNGNEATIKRVHQLANGFELMPDSSDPTYQTQLFNYNKPGTEEITVIGRVVWYTVPYGFEI